MVRQLNELPNLTGDLATFVARGKRDTVMDASLVGKDIFLEGPLRVGLRRDSMFIPTTRKPGGSTRWGARFDIKGFTNPTSLLYFTGPLHWVEKGTAPHTIQGRRRGRRRSGARALRLPNGQVRTSVEHPGTTARPFFERTKNETAEAAAKTVQAGLRRNITKAGFGSFAGSRF